MAKGLTKRQKDILDYLGDYTRDRGYPPTIREIGRAFNITSTNGVNDHLVALERKGHIRREKGAYRALEIKHLQKEKEARARDVRSVPVLGRVAAGEPILAEEHIENRIALDEQFWRHKADFALLVKGDSMKNVGIMDGDYCLVRQQEVAEKGEIVVALIEDEATVKRFYPGPESTLLKAENDAYAPIIIPKGKPVAVIGKVVGVVRNIQ